MTVITKALVTVIEVSVTIVTVKIVIVSLVVAPVATVLIVTVVLVTVVAVIVVTVVIVTAVAVIIVPVGGSQEWQETWNVCLASVTGLEILELMSPTLCLINQAFKDSFGSGPINACFSVLQLNSSL